jgi:hypothetical protein
MRTMKTLVLTLIAAAGLGCSTRHVPTLPGAVALTPASSDSSQGVWVFIESPERAGVYWCRTVAQQPVCKRAEW